jgi:pimeloyl-ACP methyl ester carboxylesterase/DNA-binding CsgD family transcriptional regulator
MALLEQEIRFCTSADGVRLAVATSGQGPPLVKASNWISHVEFDLTSPVWSHVVTELSREHRLIRYDQRGSGLSQWDVQRLDFESWVSDLEAVVDTLGLERFPLLGISQGASIAVAYAARHPERVSHVIVYGGRGPTPGQREDAELIVKLTELGWGRSDPSFRQVFAMQFAPDGTPEQHQWFNDLARISASPENAVRMMRVFNDIDVVDLLAQVACPVLVLHASGDARVPFGEGRLFASHIPDARFVPLESKNHLLLQDEPAWRRWIDEVRAFLPPVPRPVAAFATLTPRELELLRWIAEGRDNNDIAVALGLSEKTVRNHISSIYAKLEVDGRAQAIVMAREAGFGETRR